MAQTMDFSQLQELQPSPVGAIASNSQNQDQMDAVNELAQFQQAVGQQGNGAVVAPGGAVPRGIDNPGQQLGMNDDEGDAYYEEDAIDFANIHGLTKKNIGELGNKICNMIAIASQKRDRTEKAVERWRDAFEMRPIGDNQEKLWRNSSRVVAPDTFVYTTTAAGKMVSDLIHTDRPFRLTSTFPEDKEASIAVERYIEDTLLKILSLRKRLTQEVTTALVDSGCFLRPFWRRESRVKRERVVVNDALLNELGIPIPQITDVDPNPIVQIPNSGAYRYGEKAVIETERIWNNHPDYEAIALNRMVVFPAESPTIEAADMVGHVFVESVNEVRAKSKRGEYDKKQVENLLSGKNGVPKPNFAEGTSNRDDTFVDEMRLNRAMVDKTHESEYPDEELKPLKMFFGVGKIVDANNDGIYEMVEFVIELSTATIVRCNVWYFDYPYIPLSPLQALIGSLVGYSMPGLMRHVQAELTASTRMGINNSVLASSVLVEIDRAAPSNQGRDFIPGVNYHYTSKDGEIRAIHKFPANANDTLPQRSIISQMGEKIAGLDVTQVGAQAGGDVTLGQSRLSVDGANIRGQGNLCSLADSIRVLTKSMLELSRFYIEDDPNHIPVADGVIYSNINTQILGVMDHCVVDVYTEALDRDASLRYQTAEKRFQTKINNPIVSMAPNKFQMVGSATRQYLMDMGEKGDIAEQIGDETLWQQLDEQAQMMSQMGAIAPNGEPGQPGQPQQPQPGQ